MIQASNEHPKVKILKKVRRLFLTKTPDENEQQVVDPAAHYLTNVGGFPIKASIGLIEVNRKLRIGPEYLNFYFNVESTIVEDQPQIKTVTLNYCSNENKPILPWEYTTRRLESFGDLDLALWAHRVKNHYENYAQAMTNIYDYINSDNPEVQRQMTKMRLRIALARREIESNYPYTRHTQFLKRDSDQPLSSCYSEKFLKALGYTPEAFIEWSKKNGIPKLLETDSEVYDVIIKGFLSQTPMISESIQEGPESDSVIYNKEGSKMKVRLRFVNILDPTPEGIFYYSYIILCAENIKQIELESREAVDDGIQKNKAICKAIKSESMDDDEESS